MRMKDERLEGQARHDAVLAFFGLVRAVADGNESAKRRFLRDLQHCGFRVQVGAGDKRRAGAR